VISTPQRPRVSVVVPTYGRERVLGRALDSVLGQSVVDLEVIVVDDASPDSTRTAVERYRNRVHYLRHQANRGGSAARNTGIAASRAPLVAFLDDDDEWLPGKLERQLELIDRSEPDVGVVYCGFEKVSERTGEVVETSVPPTDGLGPIEFLRSTRFATSVAVVRREHLEAIGGFDEALVGSQDRDLWLRLARRCRLVGLPDVLVRHHVHAGQITSALGTKIQAKERMLRKYRAELEEHPEILANDLWRLGLLCCADGRPVEGRRYFWRAVREAPGATPSARDLLLCLVTPRATCRRLARSRFRHLDGIPQYY
jgi:glycosyltransferase involved in cell wall biosynthesis